MTLLEKDLQKEDTLRFERRIDMTVEGTKEKTNKWIPLTKDTIPPYWELVWVTHKRGWVDVCQLGHEEHYWYSREEEWRYEFDSIIAWMPYEEPEPYKAKGDCE